MRCEGGIAQRGDRTFEIEDLCGTPDLREPLSVVRGNDGALLTVSERWYYNPGPQGLVRMIDFRDGRVRRFESGGYGYRTFPGSGCSAQSLRRGMNRMELLGTCGPPDAQQTLPPIQTPGFGHGHHAVRHLPVREEWFYTFGSGQLSRIVTLEHGRVTRVETGRRTH